MTTKEITAEKGIRLCVMGGDRRQVLLAQLLSARGFSVSLFATEDTSPQGGGGATLASALAGVRAIIAPLPLSPDGITLNCRAAERPYLADVFQAIKAAGSPTVFAGAVSASALRMAARHDLDIRDYGSSEELAVKNAIPTAEGAVEVAMREMSRTVHGAHAVVLGYGKCARPLAQLLLAMHAQVCGVARSPAALAQMYADGISACHMQNPAAVSAALASADVVFNTVPALVLNEARLCSLRENTLVIDLASAPGGVERETAERLGIRVIHALSLPGKCAPLTAAEILADTLLPSILALPHLS